MADDVTVDNGGLTDYAVATDDDGAGKHVQVVKLAQSADGSRTPITADGNGLEVQITNASLVVDASGAAVPVTDNGGSLTVDGTVAVTHAALTELATAIDTELQVDVVGALPAGTNNIGDVDVASSALPTGAATAAKQDTTNGHLDGVEGLLTTIDADTGTVAGAVAGTEMQVDVVAALPAGTNAIGKLAANTGVDIGDVDVTSIAAGDNNIGNVDIVTVPAPLSTTGGGTEATAHRVTIASDSTGVLSVDDNGGALTVDATDLDIRNLDVAQDDVRVGGMAAHDAAVADNPVAIGGRSNDAVPAEVSADGEAVWAWMLRNGAQMVANAPHLGMIADPYTLLTKTVQVTTTQTGSDIMTVTSGKRLVVTYCQIQAAATTAATVQVWFGATADTTYSRGTDRAIFDGEFAPSATLKPGFVASPAVPWIGAVDEELHLTTSAGITLTVTVWYYEA